MSSNILKMASLIYLSGRASQSIHNPKHNVGQRQRAVCFSLPPLPLWAGSRLMLAGPGHRPGQHAAPVTRLSPHGSHQENDLGQDFFPVQGQKGRQVREHWPMNTWCSGWSSPPGGGNLALGPRPPAPSHLAP